MLKHLLMPIRKTIIFTIVNFILVSCLLSQSKSQDYKTITQAQYEDHFPIDIEDASSLPTNDVVYILPSNEKDSAKQAEINIFYKDTLIAYYNSLPSQKSRIVTDIQALNIDLTDVNICAFGTCEGNLWTKKFLQRAIDFPIKIYPDSIVTDSVYKGNQYIVNAAWYNPDNYKHSVVIYTPQSIDNARDTLFWRISQYSIFQNNKLMHGSFAYHLKNGKWLFAKSRDSKLKRGKEHDSAFIQYAPIGNDYSKYPTLEQVRSCLLTEKALPIDAIKLSASDNESTDFSHWRIALFKKHSNCFRENYFRCQYI
jgi:hypothetical protein